MAEPVVHVEMTTSFLERLATIESLLTDKVSTASHVVHLLSIRHRRALLFQDYRMWAGPACSPKRDVQLAGAAPEGSLALEYG